MDGEAESSTLGLVRGEAVPGVRCPVVAGLPKVGTNGARGRGPTVGEAGGEKKEVDAVLLFADNTGVVRGEEPRSLGAGAVRTIGPRGEGPLGEGPRGEGPLGEGPRGDGAGLGGGRARGKARSAGT